MILRVDRILLAVSLMCIFCTFVATANQTNNVSDTSAIPIVTGEDVKRLSQSPEEVYINIEKTKKLGLVYGILIVGSLFISNKR